MTPRRAQLISMLLPGVLAHAAWAQELVSPAAERNPVWVSEQGFAESMAHRDFARFATFVCEEAIFFSGAHVARGKAAVLAEWKPYFEGAQPPFSWAPDQVELIASAHLALSTGLVRDAQGMAVGRFNSIWQRQPDGHWCVLFDKGSPLSVEERR